MLFDTAIITAITPRGHLPGNLSMSGEDQVDGLTRVLTRLVQGASLRIRAADLST